MRRSGKKLGTFEFSRPFILNDILLRKIKQPLKIVEANHTGISVSKSVLFGQENKNANFHNFLPDLQKNPDNFLNPRH